MDVTGREPRSVARGRALIVKKNAAGNGSLYKTINHRYRYHYEDIVDAYDAKSSRISDSQFELAVSLRATRIAKSAACWSRGR